MTGFVGTLPYFNDAVAGTKQTVKDAPAKLFGLKLVNTTAAAAYLQVFDKLAANVTVGTTTPTFCVRLAANESISIQFPDPVDFQLGLTVAGCTTATGLTGAAVSVLALYQ